jgi:hypothetical protein
MFQREGLKWDAAMRRQSGGADLPVILAIDYIIFSFNYLFLE